MSKNRALVPPQREELEAVQLPSERPPSRTPPTAIVSCHGNDRCYLPLLKTATSPKLAYRVDQKRGELP